MIEFSLLEIINEYVILPIILLTFFILIYIVVYIHKKDSNVIRSRIFLNYSNFKAAFSLFSLFGLMLIIHVALVYNPHIFYSILNCSPSMANELQHFFGLMLSLTLIAFVGLFYKCIK